MNHDNLHSSRDYLNRLGAQINAHLPQGVSPTQCGSFGEAVTPGMLPLERLPTVAALVRKYIECEAILAGMESDQRPGKQDQVTD